MPASEKIPVEVNLDNELKSAQISFYRWETWLMRILIILIVMALGVISLCIIFGLIGSVVVQDAIKNFIESLSSHTGSY